MLTDANKSVKKATPGIPVEVTGFPSPANEETAIVDNEEVTRQIEDKLIHVNSIKFHSIRNHFMMFSNIKKI